MTIQRMKNPNSVFNVKLIKQGGSDSEVIICFSTKFEVSVDLTVQVWDLPYVTVINDLWKRTMLSLTNICVLFGDCKSK